jgi:signal transduction histidine kinase
MNPQERCHESLNVFRHEVTTPLTTIYGRAQLLERVVARSPSLTAEEQAQLLDGLATIEAAVQEAVLAIEGLRPQSSGYRREELLQTR